MMLRGGDPEKGPKFNIIMMLSLHLEILPISLLEIGMYMYKIFDVKYHGADQHC